MAADVELKLDKAAIARVTESPTGEVGQFLEKKGVKAEQIAKDLVPTDSGRLKSSITHALVQDSDGLAIQFGSQGVEYATFVELGTRFRPATPYLRPAMRQVMSR